MHKRYYYLIKIQFLGYRLHGWQHQPGLKTVEGLLRKTLKFVMGETKFKVLGAGRTDAMVSAIEAAFELFIDEHELEDLDGFLKVFNRNLPPDIRALSIKKVDAQFNIINDSKKKEYIYLFAFGEKSHPFCAPMLATFLGDLDLDLMMKGAKLFEGKHNFKNFCTKPTEHTVLEREVHKCEITRNELISANFFPSDSFALHVHGTGFLRNQIRLMMGTLVLLGRGEITLELLKDSLDPQKNIDFELNFIAPGSGLILNEVSFT